MRVRSLYVVARAGSIAAATAIGAARFHRAPYCLHGQPFFRVPERCDFVRRVCSADSRTIVASVSPGKCRYQRAGEGSARRGDLSCGAGCRARVVKYARPQAVHTFVPYCRAPWRHCWRQGQRRK
jgi:hypothetical protein